MSQPVSSVVRMAEEACEAEGVTLADLDANRPKHGGHLNRTLSERRRWAAVMDRVCARIMAGCGSYDDAGAAFGCSRETIRASARRGERLLNIQRCTTKATNPDLVGAMAAGRPLYDDGED